MKKQAVYSRRMNKIAFLDRDGVINRELGRYVEKPEEWEIDEKIIPVLQFLKQKGYLFVITTNQGGIARGLFSHETLAQIHEKMKTELLRNNIQITEIFYCPHHPNYSMCLCRKHLSGMLERGFAKYRGDKKYCLMMGDTERDSGAANAFGIPIYRIASNKSDYNTFLEFYNTHFNL